MKNIYSLFKEIKIVSLKRGEILIPEDSLEKEVYLIRKGLVRSYTVTEKGDEITFQLYAETNVFTNVHAVLFNEPSEFSYQALEATRVFAIDYDALMEVASRNQKLFEWNRKNLSQKVLKRAFRRATSFVFKSPEERYINFVNDNPKLVDRVPDKYIAHVLGITPVSLSRIRNRIANKK